MSTGEQRKNIAPKVTLDLRTRVKSPGNTAYRISDPGLNRETFDVRFQNWNLNVYYTCYETAGNPCNPIGF